MQFALYYKILTRILDTYVREQFPLLTKLDCSVVRGLILAFVKYYYFF